MSKQSIDTSNEFKTQKELEIDPECALEHDRQMLQQLSEHASDLDSPNVASNGDIPLGFDLSGIPLNMTPDFYLRMNQNMEYAFNQPNPVASPQYLLRSSLVPTLANLSNIILSILGKPVQEASAIVTNPASEMGMAFTKLMSMFRMIKDIYTDDSFIYPAVINMRTPSQRSAVRRANLAIFLSAVYGALQIGFFHLNENFLEVFAPDEANILTNQGTLYMELKTQAYISAMAQAERPKEDILNDLFPSDMAQRFLLRRNAKIDDKLTYVEKQILEKCAARKERLSSFTPQEALNEVYPWGKFLNEIACYIHNNHSSIAAIPVPNGHVKRKAKSQGGRYKSCDENSSPSESSSDLTDGLAFGLPTATLDATSEAHNVSSVVLYDQVRNMTSAGNGSKRAKKVANRRTWTKEEEEALLDGLDLVKGPRWSQILELYGPGGKKNEVLKHRNQVQLKDKARNMKLFFLKSGQIVPAPLQCVTGDLRRE
ncbi:DNA binding factor Trf1 [Schizosaccharomyces cryophilus OY26]|uniref:DNA binding factor Trf1 n=1 Tax=Schizosaccharomyces cryophilus (strain OY26 / ATCC MYA-4695 / CBS 11777 / NBRC 106824 / NRRL Y48691) TaxID=653667 RepID=S9W2U6_SCHCR|nr:DNA binding factor Trf1 [Schizosaccharomyces cryophilus OY26]EPY52869.1 DNA binding factor Trf1 [Schizosaccharomyces cryophilus OY26]